MEGLKRGLVLEESVTEGLITPVRVTRLVLELEVVTHAQSETEFWEIVGDAGAQVDLISQVAKEEFLVSGDRVGRGDRKASFESRRELGDVLSVGVDGEFRSDFHVADHARTDVPLAITRWDIQSSIGVWRGAGRKAEVPAEGHGVGLFVCDLDFIDESNVADARDAPRFNRQVALVGEFLIDRVVEFVDHLHEHFVVPTIIKNAHYMPPLKPGAGGEMFAQTISDFTFPAGKEWITA